MKGFLGFVCLILLLQGAGGLVYEVFDWGPRLWALTHRIGFLDDHQVYVCIGLIALGLAVGAAADAIKQDKPPATPDTD